MLSGDGPWLGPVLAYFSAMYLFFLFLWALANRNRIKKQHEDMLLSLKDDIAEQEAVCMGEVYDDESIIARCNELLNSHPGEAQNLLNLYNERKAKGKTLRKDTSPRSKPKPKKQPRPIEAKQVPARATKPYVPPPQPAPSPRPPAQTLDDVPEWLPLLTYFDVEFFRFWCPELVVQWERQLKEHNRQLELADWGFGEHE